MRLLLVLAPGAALDPSPLVPGGRLADVEVCPAGLPREAGLLGLLGQDVARAWTGPAAFAAAAAGLELVLEEETAYLLELVRLEGDQIQADARPLGPVRQGEILAHLAETIDDEPVQLRGGEPAVLIVGEPCTSPPAQIARPLAGRAVTDLAPGPPALLAKVIRAAREACAEHGRSGHTLFPHAPAGPGELTPLREAWLGLGRSAVVGSGPEAKALATLLSLTHVPARPGQELEQARAEAEVQDLVVAVCQEPPASLGDWGDAVVVVAGDAAPNGSCALAWRGGGALGEGEHLLWSLVGEKA